MIPDWIYLLFTFALGCCIGSFLNVVIYRLPRGKSLVFPGSTCPHCGRAIRPYDNIPLLSWLWLGAKCRFCKGPVSVRYFVVELLTGSLFTGLFIAFFQTSWRSGMPAFLEGGWLIYLNGIILLAVLVAASGIDLELWIIPLELCWFATLAALLVAAVGGYLIDPATLREYHLLPQAGLTTGALAVGALIGLGLSLVLVKTGLLRRSYADVPDEPWPPIGSPEDDAQAGDEPAAPVRHRREALLEILFLAPVVLGMVLAWWVTQWPIVAGCWTRCLTVPAVSGLLGALWGYVVGCGVVWAVRILGTLAFAKEAMGLGDVHLMGAVGAALGPLMVVMAFFIAPFFGLGWALFQWIARKTRQIPYGPFLSMGTLTVMIFFDVILALLWAGTRQ